jgi:hypothetical protein
MKHHSIFHTDEKSGIQTEVKIHAFSVEPLVANSELVDIDIEMIVTCPSKDFYFKHVLISLPSTVKDLPGCVPSFSREEIFSHPEQNNPNIQFTDVFSEIETVSVNNHNDARGFKTEITIVGTAIDVDRMLLEWMHECSE